MTHPALAQLDVAMPPSLIPSADGRPQPTLAHAHANPALAESSFDHLVREYGIYDDALLHAVKFLLAHEVHHRTASALPRQRRPAQAAPGFWARLVNF
jgi:hypothetical protein